MGQVRHNGKVFVVSGQLSVVKNEFNLNYNKLSGDNRLGINQPIELISILNNK